MPQIFEVLFAVVILMLVFGVITLPARMKKASTRIEVQIPKTGINRVNPDSSIALEQAASSGKANAKPYGAVDQKTAPDAFRRAKEV